MLIAFLRASLFNYGDSIINYSGRRAVMVIAWSGERTGLSP
jgi:hypothetical protein